MKQKEKAEATKERILTSAETLFAQQGYSGTSIRQIVSDAGLSIQTLHYHFTNKLSLYHSVMERSLIPLLEMLNRHIDEAQKKGITDETAFENWQTGAIDELFDIFYANQNLPKLYFRQWLQQDEDLLVLEFDRIIPAYLEWTNIGERFLVGDEKKRPDLRMILLNQYWMYTGLFVNSGFISELTGIPKDSEKYLSYLKKQALLMTLHLNGKA